MIGRQLLMPKPSVWVSPHALGSIKSVQRNHADPANN